MCVCVCVGFLCVEGPRQQGGDQGMYWAACLRGGSRGFSTGVVRAQAAKLVQFGAPLRVQEEVLDPAKMGNDEVLVRVLAAPINHADWNIMQGHYGTLPKLPAFVGLEGAAEVEAVGAGVTSLKPSDRVMFADASLGSWRTHAVGKESAFLKVSKDIPVEYAASMSVNLCTAWRMLHDFVSLSPGDVVVQNGGSSQVGQAVVQIAAQMGVKTVSTVRNSPGVEQTIERLKALGGTVVVLEEYAESFRLKKLISDLPPPKLALNCVGGPPAHALARLLDKGATMVTYGGMSKKPVESSTSSLIFKDLHVVGFWMSRWVEEHSREERQHMVNQLTELIRQGKLKQFMVRHPFSDLEGALAKFQDPAQDRKVVLTM